MKSVLFTVFLSLFINYTYAQPFSLQSVNEAKQFRLTLYFGTNGKGAFVQYAGQVGVIELRIKSCTVDSAVIKNEQPAATVYQWDEIIDGKITGSYGLTEKMGTASDVWYKRSKDGKRFSLEQAAQKKGVVDFKDKLLLHGALLSFSYDTDNLLTIDYFNRKTVSLHLPEFDSPNAARQAHIEDYNFDGYDDIGFSIPDAGMGVYRIFAIWLYDPATKRFEKLQDPDYSKSHCSELCDVTINKTKKLLYTACRGGANWWQDVYRFVNGKKLVWVQSNKTTNDE